MMLEVGQKAPDFTAPSGDGSKVEPLTLSKELGEQNIVLAFFPLAFTSVCTDELCQFRDGLAAFNNLKAKVFGISVDSPFAQNAFIKANGFEFKLISDFNREIIQKYGVMHETLGSLKGVAKRSIFVLDKKGVVRYKWVSEDPKVKPSQQEIISALKKIP